LYLLPDLGGKLVSLRRREGNNVLLSPPDFPHRVAPYGASFEDYDTSGFDECFPTVAACPSPDDPSIQWPDHGELWSVPWETEFDGVRIRQTVHGTQWPYRFRRTLRIEGDTLHLEYEVISLHAERPLTALWSAHPLLAAKPGGRIRLPAEVRSLHIEGSSHLQGTQVPWPSEGLVLADACRFSKLFTDRLAEGWAAYEDEKKTVLFRFDPRKTPFLGLWLCEGGWPTSRPSKHFTVALEPCSAPGDSLFSLFAAKNRALRLLPGIPETWSLSLSLPPRG
ncbi:MAG: hypothetical protein ACM3YO_06755, partial [Bacteroidota bacterium]